jgi:beta-galactosidase beta subunit
LDGGLLPGRYIVYENNMSYNMKTYVETNKKERWRMLSHRKYTQFFISKRN